MKEITNQTLKYILVFIWSFSFFVICWDITGTAGNYRWTGTLYGCDAVYGNSRNYSLLVSVIGVFLVMLTCYSLILANFSRERKLLTRCKGIENVSCWPHILIFLLIIVMYTMSVCPAACLTWGLTDIRVHPDLELLIIFLYWSTFSFGVLPYVLTNKRIRDAYIRFGSDTLFNIRCFEN